METGRHHSESTAIYILGMHEDKLCIIHPRADHSWVEKDLQGSIPMLVITAVEELRVFLVCCRSISPSKFHPLVFECCRFAEVAWLQAEEMPTRW